MESTLREQIRQPMIGLAPFPLIAHESGQPGDHSTVLLRSLQRHGSFIATALPLIDFKLHVPERDMKLQSES
jgi:hypothetical protein